MADGGTIQKANQMALENGVTVADCIAIVKEARAQGLTVPLVFMGAYISQSSRKCSALPCAFHAILRAAGYYNPFLQYGEGKLVADCAAAGVDGFIVVDLPPEDATAFVAACDVHGLGFTPLVAPTTMSSRFSSIAAVSRGFVYCVSVLGVTGARSVLPEDLHDLIRRVKSHVSLPVAVGFGISTRPQVEALSGVADGVVVGSAIVSRLGSDGVDGMSALLRELIPQHKLS
jgi:tryptophan synthase alpha subunit